MCFLSGSPATKTSVSPSACDKKGNGPLMNEQIPFHSVFFLDNSNTSVVNIQNTLCKHNHTKLKTMWKILSVLCLRPLLKRGVSRWTGRNWTMPENTRQDWIRRGQTLMHWTRVDQTMSDGTGPKWGWTDWDGFKFSGLSWTWKDLL